MLYCHIPFSLRWQDHAENLRLSAIDLGVSQRQALPKALEPLAQALQSGACAEELQAFHGLLHWDQMSDFAQRVLRHLAHSIPSGHTVTYGALATAVGCPGAARAVGTVMARNPFPILLPCHRVRSVHGLGGFMGQRHDAHGWKARLLHYERARSR